MRLFRDIESSAWLYAKGVLFVVLAAVAFSLLLLRAPRIDVAILLAIGVWASCRAYYFAFYVVEHYADPGYRFAGLIDFAKYLLHRDGSKDRQPDQLGGDGNE